MSIPAQVQQLIDSSGNNFHAKVAQWFVSNGWQLQISPYYMDQTQQKAREIDLVAEKSWPFQNMFGKPEGHVLVRLYIECKFVPSYAVFWFAEKSMREAKELVYSTGVFPANNSYTENHHYIARSARAAKLFTSSQTKGQEADIFYKALNQILSAFVAFRSGLPPPTSLASRLRGKLVSLQLPVVVCSSFKNVYAVDFLGQSSTDLVKENFQLEVQYAHGETSQSKNEYFLIDVVSHDLLAEFVESVEQDVTAAITLNASS
jgi:hypothetical protein